jgi:ribosomal-protein-serine acetyltransferase
MLAAPGTRGDGPGAPELLLVDGTGTHPPASSDCTRAEVSAERPRPALAPRCRPEPHTLPPCFRLAPLRLSRTNGTRSSLPSPRLGSLELSWGGVEPGESPWEAVVREVREETGVDADVVRLASVSWKPRRKEFLFQFVCRIVAGERWQAGYGATVEELSQLPPDRIEGDGLLLRRWHLDDAEDLARAVAESQEHLRPWMPWIAGEPKTLDQRRPGLPSGTANGRRGATSSSECSSGKGLPAGAGFIAGAAPTRLRSATGCTRRSPARALRGPRLACSRMRRSYFRGSSMSRSTPIRPMLRAPAWLGGWDFEYLGETPDEATAPGELGIDCAWRISRDAWRGRATSSH